MRSAAFLVLATAIAVRAKLPDWLSCSDVHCLYCTSERMLADCADDCQDRCNVFAPAGPVHTTMGPPPMMPVVDDNGEVDVFDPDHPASDTEPALDEEPSTTTTTPPAPAVTDAPKKNTLSTDAKFAKCCAARHAAGRMGAGCLQYCSFKALTKAKLIQAYTQKKCPKEDVGQVLSCGSQDTPQVACCTTGAQPYTGAYWGICTALCNPAKLTADPRLLRCLDRLAPMRRCFEGHMATVTDDNFN